MTINALHAAAIEAFRDRLASLGINVLEVLETARLGRGATAGAQSPPTVHEVLETAVAISGDTTLAKNRQWSGSCQIWYLRFRPHEQL